MANQTVYPYGTGGELPVNIGIIDDLTTGGADKALSAQQGVVIRNSIYDTWDSIDLTQLTEVTCSLGVSTWNSGGAHLAIPVTPGETIKIKLSVVSTFRGQFYTFLTSDYTTPSGGDAIPYCDGYSRIWISVDDSTNGEAELIVPDDAAYLCVCTKDTSNRVTTWLAWTLGEKSLLLQRREVVNNLYKGGVDVPLSAEMGKELNIKFGGDSIPPELTKYEYSGPLVKVAPDKHYVAAKQVSTITSIGCQGGACFGDYLFMFIDGAGTCYIYDLAKSALIQAVTGIDSSGFFTYCHSNTVNFGTEYYDANDPFPLIYVSVGEATGGYTGALVYRIVATTENDVTTYSLTLVQTLKMPGTEWTEFVTGEDGFCYLCYTSQRKIYRMNMPKLSDGDITFDLAQALSVYQFTPQPSWYGGSNNQNRFYRDGKIYFVSGSGSSTQAKLFVVLDLATERREVEIDLVNTLGLAGEPETCFIWRDHICIVWRSRAAVYALYFE